MPVSSTTMRAGQPWGYRQYLSIGRRYNLPMLTLAPPGVPIRNASKSQEERDNLPYLVTTEPAAFGDMMTIHRTFGTRILGGGCGTGDRHIEKTASQLADLRNQDLSAVGPASYRDK